MTDKEPHDISLEILKKIQATQMQHGETLAALVAGQEALANGQTRQSDAFGAAMDKLFGAVTLIAQRQNQHNADLAAHLSLLSTLSNRVARLEPKPAKVEA